MNVSEPGEVESSVIAQSKSAAGMSIFDVVADTPCLHRSSIPVFCCDSYKMMIVASSLVPVAVIDCFDMAPQDQSLDFAVSICRLRRARISILA